MSPRLRTLVTVAVWIGLFVWSLYAVLYPTWVGRLYYPDDPGNPGTWYEGGVFGLQGANGVRKQAPVWAPPQAYDSTAAPSVRWPWQRPNEGAHIELSLDRMASLLSLGAIVLGALLRGADWLGRVRRPDLLVSVAWTVSLSLVIAWICIFAIAAFTAGYGVTDEMIVSVLALGGFAGIAYGLASFWYQHSSGTAAPRSIKPTVQDSTEVGIPTAQTPIRSRAASTGAGLFWFTIGLLSAGCLTLAGGWLASFFRGPVAGTTVLGTTRYALDQTPVNATTGLSISAMGWILGVVVFRFRARRALAIGLILGTTLLGATFALWK